MVSRFVKLSITVFVFLLMATRVAVANCETNENDWKCVFEQYFFEKVSDGPLGEKGQLTAARWVDQKTLSAVAPSDRDLDAWLKKKNSKDSLESNADKKALLGIATKDRCGELGKKSKAQELCTVFHRAIESSEKCDAVYDSKSKGVKGRAAEIAAGTAAAICQCIRGQYKGIWASEDGEANRFLSGCSQAQNERTQTNSKVAALIEQQSKLRDCDRKPTLLDEEQKQLAAAEQAIQRLNQPTKYAPKDSPPLAYNQLISADDFIEVGSDTYDEAKNWKGEEYYFKNKQGGSVFRCSNVHFVKKKGTDVVVKCQDPGDYNIEFNLSSIAGYRKRGDKETILESSRLAELEKGRKPIVNPPFSSVDGAFEKLVDSGFDGGYGFILLDKDGKETRLACTMVVRGKGFHSCIRSEGGTRFDPKQVVAYKPLVMFEDFHPQERQSDYQKYQDAVEDPKWELGFQPFDRNAQNNVKRSVAYEFRWGTANKPQMQVCQKASIRGDFIICTDLLGSTFEMPLKVIQEYRHHRPELK